MACILYRKYNFHLFCPWKYKKATLKSKKLNCKIEDIFPYCPHCPNGTKLQIRFVNLAVDLFTNYCLWTELYSELIPNGGLALAILVLWYK